MESADVQVKWWDAIAAWGNVWVLKGLENVRDSEHPDAQWLGSLFPDHVTTWKRVREFLLQQGGDDRRALFFAGKLRRKNDVMLRRAAVMGYHPAQAEMSERTKADSWEESYAWAVEASSGGDRHGTYRLAVCLTEGRGCEKDMARGIELYRTAAKWDHPVAQFYLGQVAYGERDWQRYYWWGRASLRCVGSGVLRDAVFALLPSFQSGENGLILHVLSVAITDTIDVDYEAVFGRQLSGADFAKMQRVLQLHKAMLRRAKCAIDCWSIVARRLGMAKDMRVTIAKMAWDECWKWGEKPQSVLL
jgi:hypothetical protein